MDYKATWHSRKKGYECDFIEDIDGDIINSTVGYEIDRAILDDIQITSKSQADQLIELLNNLKLSLTH